MRRLNKLFWLDVGLFAVQFANGALAWHWWKHGNELMFIITGAAFVYGLFAVRRLLDFWITGFCLWWLKRKAVKAFKISMLKEGTRQDEKNN